MRRKIAGTPFVRATEVRALEAATHRSRIPTLRSVLAVGGCLLAGGAPFVACKGREGISGDNTNGHVAASASVSCAASEHAEPHIPPSQENDFMGGKPAAVKASPEAASAIVEQLKKESEKKDGGAGDAAKCLPGDPLCP